MSTKDNTSMPEIITDHDLLNALSRIQEYLDEADAYRHAWWLWAVFITLLGFGILLGWLGALLATTLYLAVTWLLWWQVANLQSALVCYRQILNAYPKYFTNPVSWVWWPLWPIVGRRHIERGLWEVSYLKQTVTLSHAKP